MSINYVASNNLADIDLTDLKTQLETFHQFIVKTVSTVVGTTKVYNRRLVKTFESDGERFNLKLNISKNRVSDLIIEYSLNDSIGNECISFDNDYEDIKTIEKDLQSIIENLSKINTPEV